MNTAKTLEVTFRAALGDFAKSPVMAMLAEGKIQLPHYKAVLREIYHYAKEDPQIQALASVYFRGEDRETVKMFLKHATSEIGHDLMALDDLKTLGADVSAIPKSLPLPSTIALTAFPFYQIQYHNPIGYLGYLYFLEYMPTQAGADYMSALKAAGVPANAMTFLHEHMTVDVAHNNLMQEYLKRLVRTEGDLSAVAYAIRVTGYLYGEMLAGAVRAVDHNIAFYPNYVERDRCGSPQASISTVRLTAACP
jgi:pyrroloquinoline quinone (PQQ) biosynthesis protein C